MGNGMNKIIPGLYVGNIRDAKDSVQLSENKITHILSIHDNAKPILPKYEYLCLAASDHAQQDLLQFMQQTNDFIHKARKIKYLCIDAVDKPEQNLSSHFSKCNDFIHKARCKGGIVLVHCLAGVSRSVTITVAYIMTVTNLNWRDALNAVRGARRCANPNFGFQRQLLSLQHEGIDKERQRLSKQFSGKKVPYDDNAELKRLLEIHQQWVLHGDQVGTDDKKEDDLYPLPLDAYGRKDYKKENTKVGKATATTASNIQAPAAQGTAQVVECRVESGLLDKLQVDTSSALPSNSKPDIDEMGTADLINEMFATDKVAAASAILAPDTNLREFVTMSRAEDEQAPATSDGVANDNPITSDVAKHIPVTSDTAEGVPVTEPAPPTASTSQTSPESDTLIDSTLDEMFNQSNIR